jgi:hypothetical protein
MVASYFGSSKDPGGLCRALSANGGVSSGGALYWQKVPVAAGGTISYIGRWDSCSLTRINQELDAGYPVIVEVRRSSSQHFVVLTGRDGSTYYVNDPAYGDRTTINARYGAPSTAIRGFRVYHGTHAAPPPPGPRLTRYEQTSPVIAYAGVWTTFTTSGASGGTYAYADSPATATFAFDGTRLDWIATKGLTQGRASLTLDGGQPVPVDLYSSSVLRQVKVWSTGTLATGHHTVIVKWLGQASVAGGGTRVNIDALDVVGALSKP